MLEISRLGGFAPAARARNVDPSAISRRVADVEARLGLRLFERTTRRLALTEAGAAYLARVEEALELLDAAREEAQATRARPSGLLRLTASVAFSEARLQPLLPDFLERFPALSLELRATDATLDLLAERIDLAIRLGPEPDGVLERRRLRPTRYRVCAAPSYIERAPPIARPADLAAHPCVRFTLPDFRSRWRFQRPDGAVEETPVSGRLALSTALGVRDAARAGLGPALLADWLIDEDLASGRLVELLPDWTAAATRFDAAAWLVYPSRRYLPAKTRAAIEFLSARLGS